MSFNCAFVNVLTKAMALWISEDWPAEAIIHSRILNAIDPEGLRASSGSVIQLKHAMIGSSA